MGAFVSIGEFSRLTHLSVKALRHYHDVGVLAPADVDLRNGYRRYNTDQLPDAHVVRRLRDLDMPLDEVKVVLGTTDAHLRDEAIAAHLMRMESELARTRSVVTSLRDLLAAPMRPFDVQHRRLDACEVVVKRATVSSAEIESWSNVTFAQLAAKIRSAGLVPAAVGGSLFESDYFARGVGDIVAFVPFVGSRNSTWPEAEQMWLEGGKYAVALHRGPYEDLDRTYGSLGSYVAEHGIGAEGPITELYLVGPDQAEDSADLRTEVCWPIKG